MELICAVFEQQNRDIPQLSNTSPDVLRADHERVWNMTISDSTNYTLGGGNETSFLMLFDELDGVDDGEITMDKTMTRL